MFTFWQDLTSRLHRAEEENAELKSEVAQLQVGTL